MWFTYFLQTEPNETLPSRILHSEGRTEHRRSDCLSWREKPEAWSDFYGPGPDQDSGIVLDWTTPGLWNIPAFPANSRLPLK